ncbi:MAG: DNA-binding protein [Candidatus Zixiibacteriota bacterium]|nr:MAG: DNA-binding protein [candidate division Zixibacteria bacterium]
MTNEAAILQLMNARGIGPRTLGKLLERLRFEGYQVSDFVEAPNSQLIEAYGLKPDIVESMKSARDLGELLFDELSTHSIRLLTIGAENYPSLLASSLEQSAPPVLFAAGNLSLLEQKAIGFCGSRKASEESCALVDRCASVLAQEGFNIISGYAYGVDLAAHHAALSNGGVTTFVLATGILHFSAKSAISDLLNDDNFLVLSEFSPRLPWTVQNAMQRNRTIIGLSQTMILTESGLQGGTFDTGKAALELQRPLFVLEYEDYENTPEGDRWFLERGANSIRCTESKNPDLSQLIERVNNFSQASGQISFL